MAMILLKKVVVEPREVTTAAPGAIGVPTIGELIDEMLTGAAHEHQQVIEIAFHVHDDEWATMGEQIRQSRPAEVDWNDGRTTKAKSR